VFFYVQGVNALNKYEDGRDTDQGLHDQAVTDRTVTQVLAVFAGALAVTSGVLFFTSPSSPSATSLRVGPTGASLRVTF
jgi:hypothetical protein